MWTNAHTLAAGLRVPKPYGDCIILDILKKSGGAAIEAPMTRSWKRSMIGRREGVFAAPEGAASLVAYRKLLAIGFLKPEDEVVLFNTGSGLKYIDVIAEYANRRAQRTPAPKTRQIGGIIGPY